MLEYDLLEISQIAELLKKSSAELENILQQLFAKRQMSDGIRKIYTRMIEIHEQTKNIAKGMEDTVFNLKETERIIQEVVDSIRNGNDGNGQSGVANDALFSNAANPNAVAEGIPTTEEQPPIVNPTGKTLGSTIIGYCVSKGYTVEKIEYSKMPKFLNDKGEEIDLITICKELENSGEASQEEIPISIREELATINAEELQDEVALAYQASIPFHNKSLEEVGGEQVVRYKVKSYFSEMGYDVSEAIDNTKLTIIPANEWQSFLAENGLSPAVEAYCCEDGIVMPSNIASNTLVHELIHCVGKVEDKGWEEAITEYIAQTICDVEHMTGYDPSVQAMVQLAATLKEKQGVDLLHMVCEAKVKNSLVDVKQLLANYSSPEEVDAMTKMLNKLNIDRFKGMVNSWSPYWDKKEVEFGAMVSNLIGNITGIA